MFCEAIDVCVCVCVCVYTHTYIYVYIYIYLREKLEDLQIQARENRMNGF